VVTVSEKLDAAAAALVEKIAEQVAAGPGAWVMPWDRAGGGLPCNAATGARYTGGNVVALWAAGFTSPTWSTYKQWQELGAQVRKGEKGTHLMKVTPVRCKDHGPDEMCSRCGRVARAAFVVFSAEQVDGWTEPARVPRNVDERNAAAELWLQRTGADVRHGGTRACYSPGTDVVTLPEFDRFDNAGTYYGTAAHELVHWTGHTSRLDRIDRFARYGSAAYAFEELVAEIGAAMVCAELGLETEPQPGHAQYVANWLQVLQGNPAELWRAGKEAQRAADMLRTLTGAATTAAPVEVAETVDA
jgi:antirestriction protein ArdC